MKHDANRPSRPLEVLNCFFFLINALLFGYITNAAILGMVKNARDIYLLIQGSIVALPGAIVVGGMYVISNNFFRGKAVKFMQFPLGQQIFISFGVTIFTILFAWICIYIINVYEFGGGLTKPNGPTSLLVLIIISFLGGEIFQRIWASRHTN